jgi:hypothetical protein
MSMSLLRNARSTSALLLAGLMVLAMTLMVSPATASTHTGQGPINVATDLVDDAGNVVGTFEGTLSNLTATAGDDGQVLVTGFLEGVATVGGETENVAEEVSGIVDSGEEGCQILFLELGPLFLDLLGLQVFLDQVTLDITAVPGAGALLGNLLCAVAGLLDGPQLSLDPIVRLLNRIFDLLG